MLRVVPTLSLSVLAQAMPPILSNRIRTHIFGAASVEAHGGACSRQVPTAMLRRHVVSNARSSSLQPQDVMNARRRMHMFDNVWQLTH